MILFENEIIYIEGILTKATTHRLYRRFQKNKRTSCKKIILRNIAKIDHAGVALVESISEIYGESPPQVVLEDKSASPAFDTFGMRASKNQVTKKEDGFLISLGEQIYISLILCRKALILTSDILYWSVMSLIKKRGHKRGAILTQSLIIGANALPIVGLLSFSIGLIMALLSAAQLRNFGANIFIADLISIAMVREMGPMMTAILVAGRSGSSIASEIATMKVSEELDALNIMAINPIRYIVAPKFIAITICMPLLTGMAMVIGILGGMVIAVFYLDLNIPTFILEVVDRLSIKDFTIGLSKSFCFAWCIVIIGSLFGFNVTGGAEGVGRATTQSVVTSIFTVILLDAFFALTYL